MTKGLEFTAFSGFVFSLSSNVVVVPEVLREAFTTLLSEAVKWVCFCAAIASDF